MLMIMLFPIVGNTQSRIIRIYQDADLSNNAESAQAIQWGIELAFDEIDNEIEGYKVDFEYLDHRGNVVRSKNNYRTFQDDPSALVMFAGLHSPPLIKNREFINQSKALTMVPWAAGSPITRHPSELNWIFRLSLDDKRAGPALINYAVDEKECTNPRLLLEQTPWGDSNLKIMSAALFEKSVKNTSISRFSWNIKKTGARAILRDIANEGNDCIVLVSNTVEAETILGELVKLPLENRVPVISHWGITGADLPSVITAKDREGLDLHFIHTCFAFTNENQSGFAKQVFSRLEKYTSGAIDDPVKLKSAVGFIHAYDLSRLLIQAIKQAGLTGDIDYDRNAIRLALEDMHDPVIGLVKTYKLPFSVFNEVTNANAHEALTEDDYCMGYFGPNNEVLIVRN